MRDFESELIKEGRKPVPMIPVGFRIPVEIDDWAKQVAEKLEVNKSDVIRKLIEIGWDHITNV